MVLLRESPPPPNARSHLCVASGLLLAPWPERAEMRKKIKNLRKKKKKAAGWDHPVAWEGDLAPGFWGGSKSSQSPALEGGGVPAPLPAGRGKPELLVGSGGGIWELDGLAAAGVGAGSWPSATVTAPLSESLFSRSSFDSNTNT